MSTEDWWARSRPPTARRAEPCSYYRRRELVRFIACIGWTLSAVAVSLFPLPRGAIVANIKGLISSLDVEDASLLGPEDNPHALRKYLLDNQRFGGCPCFPKTLFERVGGYNEDYRGRGPEDQDIIERVCDNGLTLVRSYDLLYFHMAHGTAEGWDDAALLAANREYFSKSRQTRIAEAAGNRE